MVIMSSNNNNDNMLSTTSCKSSATTTANPILSNNTRATNTTSSCPSPPLAAAMAKQQQQALKCPRCDSSNTKFCYYNNYSLSQPRHFCKACKRYWTRGGTLRNVPVGGGCRKNKRAKKAPAAANTMAAVTSNQKNSSLLSPHPSATATSDHLKSLFFDMPSAAVASSMNLASTSAFPTLPQMYNLQPQMSALGIRFSSGRTNHHDQKYQSGFASSLADLQQPGSFLNSYQPPYDQELHVEPNRILELPKQVKVEGTTSVNGSDGVGIEWQDQDQDQFDVGTNIAAPGAHSGDSSFLYWSSAILGAAGWPDIANSSIAPLI